MDMFDVQRSVTYSDSVQVLLDENHHTEVVTW